MPENSTESTRPSSPTSTAPIDTLKQNDVVMEEPKGSRSRSRSPRKERSHRHRRHRSRSRSERKRRRSRSTGRDSRRTESRREVRRDDSRDDSRRESRRRDDSRDEPRRESRRDERRDDRRDDRYSRKTAKSRSRSPPRPRSATRDMFTWRRVSPAPHLTADERDFRTVFVMQLSQRVQPREIADFFSKAGKVHDVRIVNDRITAKSKGVAYVEFVDIKSVSQALALTGHRMNGVPLVVEETMSEKNRVVKQDEHTVQDGPAEETKVYASSIHHTILEPELKNIFESCGSVEFVDLHKDPKTGLSKGFAYIQFYNSNDAKEAVERLNGFRVSGKALSVGLVTEKTIPVYGVAQDNDEDAIALSGTSRHELMAKLAASRKLESSAQRPSKCMLIKNAFDPSLETEPGWDTDIQEDFSSECQKFGKVLNCFVDPATKGYIYLKFMDTDSSKKAISVLDARFFAGRQLSAAYFSETSFPKVAFI